MPVALGKNENCSLCKRTAIVCHSVKRAGKYYHRECLVCQTCRCRLEEGPTLKEDVNGYFYCLGCYMVLPSTEKSRSRCTSEVSQARNSRWGAAPKCAYCSQTVYAQDQRSWGGKVYHRGDCFRCSECAKVLEDTSVCEQCREQPCCRSCWNKGRRTASTSTFNPVRCVCPVCHQECHRLKSNVVEVGQKVFHSACLRCFQCDKQLDPVRMMMNGANCYCRPCYNKQFTHNPLAQTFKLSNVCVECGKDVSVQELLRLLGKVYHSNCIKCSACSRKVEFSTAVTENDKLYCRGCHTRLFKLNQTAKSTFVFGSNVDKCSACGKACYVAERVQVFKDGIFHPNCIRCSICNVACKASNVGVIQGKLHCLQKCYKLHVGRTSVSDMDVPKSSATQQSNNASEDAKVESKVAPIKERNVALGVVSATEQQVIKPENTIEEETCPAHVEESPVSEVATEKPNFQPIGTSKVGQELETIVADVENPESENIRVSKENAQEACEDNEVCGEAAKLMVENGSEENTEDTYVDKAAAQDHCAKELDNEISAEVEKSEDARVNSTSTASEISVDKVDAEKSGEDDVNTENCHVDYDKFDSADAEDANALAACANSVASEEVRVDKEDIQDACVNNVDTDEVEQVLDAQVQVAQVMTEEVSVEQVLDAEEVQVEQAVAEEVSGTQVMAEEVMVEQVDAEEVNVEQVMAEEIQVEQVDAEEVSDEQVEDPVEQVAEEIRFQQEVDADEVHVEQVDAEEVSGTQFDAEVDRVEQVMAEEVNVEQVMAEDERVEQVDAEEVGDEQVEDPVEQVAEEIRFQQEVDADEVRVEKDDIDEANAE